MKEDKCWAGCGSEGNHPEWGPHYWPCGTMKCSSIRGEACYEREIARKDALIEEWKEVSKELLNVIKVANDAIQYLEPKLDKKDENIFLRFHVEINAVSMKDRPAIEAEKQAQTILDDMEEEDEL